MFPKQLVDTTSLLLPSCEVRSPRRLAVTNWSNRSNFPGFHRVWPVFLHCSFRSSFNLYPADAVSVPDGGKPLGFEFREYCSIFSRPLNPCDISDNSVLPVPIVASNSGGTDSNNQDNGMFLPYLCLPVETGLQGISDNLVILAPVLDVLLLLSEVDDCVVSSCFVSEYCILPCSAELRERVQSRRGWYSYWLVVVVDLGPLRRRLWLNCCPFDAFVSLCDGCPCLTGMLCWGSSLCAVEAVVSFWLCWHGRCCLPSQCHGDWCKILIVLFKLWLVSSKYWLSLFPC